MRTLHAGLVSGNSIKAIKSVFVTKINYKSDRLQPLSLYFII